MKRTAPRIIALMLALFMILPMSVFAQTRPAPADMADFLVQIGVVSVQYAMMEDGEITAQGTAGVYGREINLALTEGTMYGSGSVSKMFTTVVIMSLVDGGQIQLDTPVKEYLPGFEMADPRYADITVRHLLNHSSGLMGSTFVNAFLWEDTDPDSRIGLLQRLKTQRLKADPGAFSVYCNDGFTLLELLAEEVTGQPFSALVQQIITQPLEMTNTATMDTRVQWDGFAQDRLARTYSALDGVTQMPAEYTGLTGTGGVYSTANDLAAFGQIFTGESDILSDEARLATMESEHLNGRWLEDVEHNILGYGLGWDSVELFPFSQYGITALWKGGDAVGYHASLVVLPEYNMSAAVMTSGGSSTYNMMLACELLLQRLYEKGIITEYAPALALPSEEAVELDIDVSPYSGIYAATGSQYTISFDEDGGLILTLFAGQGAYRLPYTGDGKWVDNQVFGALYFVQQDGYTYLVNESVSNIPGFGQTTATTYLAQKLPDYTPSEEVLAAWMARSGLSFLNVTDKYTSVAYSFTLPMMGFYIDPSVPGYMVGYKLEDADSLTSVIEIPIAAGRDLLDVEVFTLDNGTELASAAGSVYQSIASVPLIWGGSYSICTIQPEGYTRWYILGSEMDGRTLTIDCPENSGFAVYDANGICVNHSAISGEYSFVAQAGGFIAFIGEAGTVFTINAH